MQISEQGLALIEQFEGFSPTPYLCPAGKWTIGYGHMVQENEHFTNGLSQKEAKNMLKQDVICVEQGVVNLVAVDMTQNQFDALVSLTYNIGIEAFENSTLLRLLNAGNTNAAAGQFTRWDHCGGKPLEGLTIRRNAEMVLFNTTGE